MSLEERVARLEVTMASNSTLLLEIRTKLDDLSEQFIKHKGFIGGIIFTISSLWALGLIFLKYFISNGK